MPVSYTHLDVYKRQGMSNSASNLPARRKKFSARDVFATFGVYALLIFMALLVLTPIVWIIGASFNPMRSLLSATAFPENPTVLHYVKLIKETKLDVYKRQV